MEYITAQLQPDRWLWAVEHAVAIGLALLTTAALVATATWVLLQARYRRTIRQQHGALKAYEKNLRGATPEEARRRLESLQARLDRLEPRRLTKQQTTILQKGLALPEAAGLTKINVAYDATCGDGKEYAADMARVLGSCRGWRPSNGTVFGWGREMASGLAIVCSKHGRTAAAAKVLSRALTEAGIEHETIVSPEDELEVVIASRHLAPLPSHHD